MVDARTTDRSARRARPCRAPSGLGLALEELGISPSAVLDRAGVPPGALREPRPWLTIDAYFALWEAIAAVADDPPLGLQLGARYPEQLLEPAFLACLGSRDLGEALARLARYKQTLCPEGLALVRRAGRIEVRYDWPTAERAPPPILVEAELSFLLHLVRKATRRPLCDARVALTRRRVHDPSRWESLLGTQVRFGAAIGTLSLPAEILALPFATFNPSLLAVLDPALEAGASLLPGVGAAASVRRVLRRRLGADRTSVEDVAGELGTTQRTLQRQLHEAGTSFAELLHEARRERATFYLRETELSLSEIAFLLAFETPSSFFRAFGRWTGQTPGAFREKVRAQRAATGLRSLSGSEPSRASRRAPP